MKVIESLKIKEKAYIEKLRKWTNSNYYSKT